MDCRKVTVLRGVPQVRLCSCYQTTQRQGEKLTSQKVGVKIIWVIMRIFSLGGHVQYNVTLCCSQSENCYLKNEKKAESKPTVHCRLFAPGRSQCEVGVRLLVLESYRNCWTAERCVCVFVLAVCL